MSADAGRGDHRAGEAVGVRREHAARNERIAQRRAAADIRFERVVGEVCDVRAQESLRTQRAHLARGQNARGLCPLGCGRDIGLRGGAVAQRAQEKFGVHLCRRIHPGAEFRRADTVGIALGVAVGRIGLGPVGNVGKGEGGRAGERFLLFAQQADEHDERFHACRRFFEVKALPVGGVGPTEKAERLERRSHRGIVDGGGGHDRVGTAVHHDRGLARDG